MTKKTDYKIINKGKSYFLYLRNNQLTAIQCEMDLIYDMSLDEVSFADLKQIANEKYSAGIITYGVTPEYLLELASE